MVPSPGPAASSTRAFHASQGPASLGIEQRNGSNSEVLTPFRWPEGNILPAQMACGRGASRCRRPHARGDVLSSELGRSYPCPESHAGSVHEGNGRTMGMHADEKSDGRMLPVKPRTKPSDIGGGDGGGTAAGRGEGELQRMPRTHRRNRHVTEAASPRIGAAWVPNTPTADHVRPETRARCGKAARRDLRGGRGAILVPTATIVGLG